MRERRDFMEKMLYTIAEAAEVLMCNPGTVYKLRNAGLLPFLKLGRLKCRREALEDFLKKYEGYDITDPQNIKPLSEDADSEGEEMP